NSVSKVHFMEANDSLRTNLFCCVGDCRNRVRLKEQNVAPDNSVEISLGVEIKQLCMNEVNIRAAFFTTTSFTSLFNDNGVPFNRSHVTRRSNEPGRKQRNIAHSAAEIEHAHPRLESGRQQELLGPLFKEPSLPVSGAPVLARYFPEHSLQSDCVERT